MRSIENIAANVVAFGIYLKDQTVAFLNASSFSRYEPVPDLRKLEPVALADDPEKLKSQLDQILLMGPDATLQWLEKMSDGEIRGTPKLAAKLKDAGFKEAGAKDLVYNQDGILNYVASQAVSAYLKNEFTLVRAGFLERLGEDYRTDPQQLEAARTKALKTLDRRSLIRYFFPHEEQVVKYDLSIIQLGEDGADKAQLKKTLLGPDTFTSMETIVQLLAVAIDSKIHRTHTHACGGVTVDTYIDTTEIELKEPKLKEVLAEVNRRAGVCMGVNIQDEVYGNKNRHVIFNFPTFNDKVAAAYVEVLFEYVEEILQERKFAPLTPSENIQADGMNVEIGKGRGLDNEIQP